MRGSQGRSRRARALAVLVGVAAGAVGAVARADEPQAPAKAIVEDRDELAPEMAPRGFAYEVMGSLFFGDGLRFNNPYRLQTQLGDDARTVSVTAPYVDLGIAAAVGGTFGLRHGGALNLSVALSGVGQAVLVPAYFASYRGRSQRFEGFGRIGPAIILSPDANLGVEAGVGAAMFVTAKIALTAELVGDLFYGAATRETGFPVYPILSLQVGLLLDHEVLP